MDRTSKNKTKKPRVARREAAEHEHHARRKEDVSRSVNNSVLCYTSNLPAGKWSDDVGKG